MIKQYKNCIRCSKAFHVYPYEIDKRLYCSTECSNKSNGIKQSMTKRSNAKKNLSNNIRWRYNVLYIEWRNKCLARDNFICQNCGIKLNLRTAVVHHPKSWAEYPKLRYEISNGISVCRKCHNIVDERLGLGRYGYN